MGKKKAAASSSATASTTGPKVADTAQKSAAVARDPQCDWTASTITKREEKRLWSLGLISSDKRDVQFPAPKASTSQMPKRPSDVFAHEDDLAFESDEGEMDPPPSKKAKTCSERTVKARAKVSVPPKEASIIPPLPKRTLKKKKEDPSAAAPSPSAATPNPSTPEGHPIQATVAMVMDFAAQFIKLEAENAQLRESAKPSAEQLEKANRLAAEAWREADKLKKELGQVTAKLEEEERQKAEAQTQAEEKEGSLRKSIETLLGAADMPVDRANKLQVDSMSDAISFTVDSSEQIQALLQKTKAALAKLFALMFPKLDQKKILGELVDAFFVDTDGTVEADMELLTTELPKDKDGTTIDLSTFSVPARKCARQLLKLVEAHKKQATAETAPSASTQTQAL
ncbi:hypothetical protein ACQ4PT_007692 [Festuca glaucescens]